MDIKATLTVFCFAVTIALQTSMVNTEEAHVIIVGGGLAGLSALIEAIKAGAKVCNH